VRARRRARRPGDRRSRIWPADRPARSRRRAHRPLQRRSRRDRRLLLGRQAARRSAGRRHRRRDRGGGPRPPPPARARGAHRQALAGGARGDPRALPRPGPGAARGAGAARGGRAGGRREGARRAPGRQAGRRRRRNDGPGGRRGGAAPRDRELRLRPRRRRPARRGSALRRSARRGPRPGGACAARLPHAHGRGVPADQPLTLGTAGHIDQGKTALVAALTGVDTDRLPQEKARGISIELGYAPLELPSGRRLSVVDVPGHERFVRTMVAGATGIDLFLLVVAADDGVMPQTREHLAIVELLDVPAGAVALTKRDLVDDELAELARLGVEELLDEGPYAGSQVVEVSSRTGAGLGELRAALDGLAAGAGRQAG